MVPAIDSLKKAHSEAAIMFLIYILTLKVIKPILIKGSLDQKSRHRTCVDAFTVPQFYDQCHLHCVFDATVLFSDEPDGQEERRLQYLDQEKLSYITNYLEQTRDTDVHSVSTENDSGKAASNSAPSEFGFEETSGKTQSIPRVPNPSPFSICQLPQSQGG